MQRVVLRFLRQRRFVRLGAWLLTLMAVILTACATTKRAAQLVIVSGKAEEREQRAAKLQADLEQSRTALAAESDPSRQLELLKQHVALQDALISELLQQGHGHHGGGDQQAKTEERGEHSVEEIRCG